MSTPDRPEPWLACLCAHAADTHTNRTGRCTRGACGCTIFRPAPAGARPTEQQRVNRPTVTLPAPPATTALREDTARDHPDT